ncbi:unnamed protein product [Sphagnum jensenii]|uniref:Cell division protein FtsZ C-terminal domain-containing protein n=1 Tax=Sphagnum jensenii TaxID=128206 RepID=A0ABP0VGV6_9BRYO
MEAAHEDAEIIFGTVIDESLKDSVKVTVIATGLGGMNAELLAPPKTVQVQVPASAAQAEAPAQMMTPPPFTAPVQAEALTEEAGQPQVVPPQPNAAMLAAAAAAAGFDESSVLDAQAEFESGNPGIPASGPIVTGPASSDSNDAAELARARAIAQRLGITNLTDDEYDVPTYMRRQQDRDV